MSYDSWLTCSLYHKNFELQYFLNETLLLNETWLLWGWNLSAWDLWWMWLYSKFKWTKVLCVYFGSILFEISWFWSVWSAIAKKSSMAGIEKAASCIEKSFIFSAAWRISFSSVKNSRMIPITRSNPRKPDPYACPRLSLIRVYKMTLSFSLYKDSIKPTGSTTPS